MDEHENKKLTSSQLRKIKKPLIEKRRRERINESLTQLKSLILEALHKDESQYNKMEKADILELTVKHLKSLHSKHNSTPQRQQQQHLQQQQQSTPTIATSNIGAQQPILQTIQLCSVPTIEPDNYKSGFAHCAAEVLRFMEKAQNIRPEVKNHVNNMLNGKISDMSQNTNAVYCNNSNNLNIKDNMNNTTFGATYVQIVSKDTTIESKNNQECMASQMFHGTPYMQPISVLNGQSILLTNTAANLNLPQAVQPVVQLASQSLANTNIYKDQISLSPSYKENHVKSTPMTDAFTNLENRDDDVSMNKSFNTFGKKCKSQNNNLQIRDNQKSLSAPKLQHNSLIKKVSTKSNYVENEYDQYNFLSANSVYNHPRQHHSIDDEVKDNRPSFLANETNTNMNNIDCIKAKTNISHHENRHSSFTSPDAFNLNNMNTNQRIHHQCLDNMWRPW